MHQSVIMYVVVVDSLFMIVAIRIVETVLTHSCLFFFVFVIDSPFLFEEVVVMLN